MADLKISQLTGATTPLAGTEVLPIVQSSTTKKVSVADLTAGRSVSMADATLSTGNLVIGTSGKGIDFSATPGTGTSELLSDYEEGTWTPTDDSGASLSLTVIYAKYTKIGRQVTCMAWVSYPVTVNATIAKIGGLPYAQVGSNSGLGANSYNSNGFIMTSLLASSTAFSFVNATNAYVTNAGLSAATIAFTYQYFV